MARSRSIPSSNEPRCRAAVLIVAFTYCCVNCSRKRAALRASCLFTLVVWFTTIFKSHARKKAGSRNRSIFFQARSSDSCTTSLAASSSCSNKNAGPVNVAAGGNTVITALTYKNASDYLSVAPAAYTFDVTATSANATVPVAATLKAGTVNSVFAVGLFKGNPALKFVLATVNGVPGMPSTGSVPRPVAPTLPLLPWFLGAIALVLIGSGVAARRVVRKQ